MSCASARQLETNKRHGPATSGGEYTSHVIMSCLAGAGQLGRDNNAVYVRHHAAIEVAAPPPVRRARGSRLASSPAWRQQLRVRASAAQGRPAITHQRQHRVGVRVAEPREQARRPLPRRANDGAATGIIGRLLLPAFAAATTVSARGAGRSSAPSTSARCGAPETRGCWP